MSRGQAYALSSAGMPTSPTSASSPRRTGGVFSINDFDETLQGPFEWDLKRLAASIAVAGRDRGFDDAVCRSVVRATAREYREAMARFAEMRNIDVWYTRLDVAAVLKRLGASGSRKQMKRFETNVAKVHTKDSMRALTKLCQTVDGELRIVGNPPLVTPIEDVLPGAEQDDLENASPRSSCRRRLPGSRGGSAMRSGNGERAQTKRSGMQSTLSASGRPRLGSLSPRKARGSRASSTTSSRTPSV